MRKRVFAGVMVVILGVLLAVVSASAEDTYGAGYIVLKGGYFSATGKDFEGDSMKGNTYWEMAGGHDFSKFWGIEVGVGYLQAENSRIDTRAVPILFSGKVQYPIKFFVPYLKAGVGPVYFEGSSRTGKGSDSAWVWGYQAGGGFDFWIGPWILGIEAKYTAADADLKMGDVKVEGVITTANIGFRF